MGFDIYGINVRLTRAIPELPETEHEDEVIRKEYWNDLDNFYKENPGYYYRSNVWWWRPIVSFLEDNASDILSEEDIKRLNENSGHKIEGAVFKALQERFALALEMNYVTAWIDVYKNALANLPPERCYCCDGRGVLDSPPIFHDPEDDWNGDCHVCNGSGQVESFKKNYPTDLETFEEFNQFLQNCGEGFEVW